MNNFFRRFTDFILKNPLSAMGVTFVVAYIPYLGSVSVIIASFVTLRKGAMEGALVFIAATVPAVLAYFGSSNIEPNDAELAMVVLSIIIVSNLIIWLFSLLLRRYGSWSLIFEYAILLAVVLIGLLYLLDPNIHAWWVKWLTYYFSRIGTAGAENLTPANEKVIVEALSTYATGLMTASILLNAVVQLVVARWWQGIMFNPGGLRQELYEIRLSYVAGAIFLVFFGLAMSGNEIAVNIMPVIYFVFCLAGLSLTHCLVAPLKYSWVWIAVIYIFIVISFPKSVILVSLFGLLDVALNFRKRLRVDPNIK
jgi:hypothetical protein